MKRVPYFDEDSGEAIPAAQPREEEEEDDDDDDLEIGNSQVLSEIVHRSMQKRVESLGVYPDTSRASFLSSSQALLVESSMGNEENSSSSSNANIAKRPKIPASNEYCSSRYCQFLEAAKQELEKGRKTKICTSCARRRQTPYQDRRDALLAIQKKIISQTPCKYCESQEVARMLVTVKECKASVQEGKVKKITAGSVKTYWAIKRYYNLDVYEKFAKDNCEVVCGACYVSQQMRIRDQQCKRAT